LFSNGHQMAVVLARDDLSMIYPGSFAPRDEIENHLTGEIGSFLLSTGAREALVGS